MTIETRDLWQGAYLLVEGGWVEGMKVDRLPDGRKEVLFRLRGDRVETEARRFMEGSASCNLRVFRHHLNHLKDVALGGRRGG
jgi:hypothetical protein